MYVDLCDRFVEFSVAYWYIYSKATRCMWIHWYVERVCVVTSRISQAVDSSHRGKSDEQLYVIPLKARRSYCMSFHWKRDCLIQENPRPTFCPSQDDDTILSSEGDRGTALLLWAEGRPYHPLIYMLLSGKAYPCLTFPLYAILWHLRRLYFGVCLMITL